MDATGELYRFSSPLLESKEGARGKCCGFRVSVNCGRFWGSVLLGGGACAIVYYTDEEMREGGRRVVAELVMGVLHWRIFMLEI